MAVRTHLLTLSVALACLCAAPAFAQSAELAEIDQLSRATEGVQSGMALARRQIGESDLVGAVATLERLLIDHPQADDALLLHASLLCRLDDKQGARAELAEMDRVRVTETGWAEVVAACGPVPRPQGWGG